MKKFLTKLIATTLLLIVTLSSFGAMCFEEGSYGREWAEDKVKEFDKFLSTISVEIEGYKLVESESVLPFYKRYYHLYPFMVLPGEYSNSNPEYMYYDTYEHNGENYFYERGIFDFDGSGTGIYLIKGTDKIIEEDENGTYRDITSQDARYIDGYFLTQRSGAAKQIYEEFGDIKVEGIIVFDNRVFIYASTISRSTYYWGPTIGALHPPMIFEYDYKYARVNYAGFLPNFRFWEGLDEDYEMDGKVFTYKPIQYLVEIQKTN